MGHRLPRLREPVSYAADVLLQQHRAQLLEPGRRIVQRPDDLLALAQLKGDEPRVAGEGALNAGLGGLVNAPGEPPHELLQPGAAKLGRFLDLGVSADERAGDLSVRIGFEPFSEIVARSIRFVQVFDSFHEDLASAIRDLLLDSDWLVADQEFVVGLAVDNDAIDVPELVGFDIVRVGRRRGRSAAVGIDVLGRRDHLRTACDRRVFSLVAWVFLADLFGAGRLRHCRLPGLRDGMKRCSRVGRAKLGGSRATVRVYYGRRDDPCPYSIHADGYRFGARTSSA